MVAPNILPLDETRLAPLSAELTRALFARHPWCRAHARMESVTPGGEYHLLIEAPTPSAPELALVIWVEGGVEPSIAWGRWHTHAGLFASDDDHDDVAEIVSFLDDIVAERGVLVWDPGSLAAFGALCHVDDEEDPLPRWPGCRTQTLSAYCATGLNRLPRTTHAKVRPSARSSGTHHRPASGDGVLIGFPC